MVTTLNMALAYSALSNNGTIMNPILILDDVFSELDETRQKLLIDNLSVVQMFITTAEVSHINIFNKSNVTVIKGFDKKLLSERFLIEKLFLSGVERALSTDCLMLSKAVSFSIKLRRRSE